jgi:hypothetical protein
MSHTTTYAEIVTDIDRFCNAASKLGHKVKQAEAGKTITVKQYGANWVNDAVAEVHLKGWRFPIAIKANGEIKYDHWGSKAETMQHLGDTLQEYRKELITENIPWDQVSNHFETVKNNGDVVITLEY